MSASRILLIGSLIARRVAYHGARIILSQVSPESETIFDLLMELMKSCEGDWNQLRAEASASAQDLNDLLDFGAAFLDSIGNYRVSVITVSPDHANDLTGKWGQQNYSAYVLQCP